MVAILNNLRAQMATLQNSNQEKGFLWYIKLFCNNFMSN
jgi:hypothetical protein